MAKRNAEPFSTVTIAPLTGVLDTRSSPESVPAGAHRYKLNWMLSGETKLCRRPGDQRLFADQTPYTNYDFHDQGAANVVYEREAITLLFRAYLNTGPRTLYAGTQSRIAWLDQTTGIWTYITTGKSFGGPPASGVAQTRWKAAELQEVIVFTNNVDPPQYTTVLGTGIIPIDTSACDEGPINKAYVVVSFAGFILLMNLEMNGSGRKSSRIWWSDLNKPTSWGAIPDSISDFQDLDYGADILAALEMGGALYIYTTKAIWRCAPSGGSSVFSFTRIYNTTDGNKCLFLPNTLVAVGSEHWYGGLDGFYRFSPYIAEPERVEWLYRGTAVIYNDTAYAGDTAYCQSPCAVAFQEDQEIHVSWPEKNADGALPGQNTKTIIWNYLAKSVDLKDAGYTALAAFDPNPFTGSPPAACQTKPLLIGARATDLCLKQLQTIYSREICSNAATGKGTGDGAIYTPFVGQYVFEGYYSILRGIFPFGNFDRDKQLKHLLLEPHPTLQEPPCVVGFRVGNSYSESDPNQPDGLCSVLWNKLPDMPLKCLDTMTAAQYVAANLMRNLGMEWELYERGRFLYYEITIKNADGSPAIGGDACFSRMEARVRVLAS